MSRCSSSWFGPQRKMVHACQRPNGHDGVHLCECGTASEQTISVYRVIVVGSDSQPIYDVTLDADEMLLGEWLDELVDVL